MDKNQALIETLELLLDDWRWAINKAYAYRDSMTDQTDIDHYQREVDRRLSSIKRLEQLIKVLKG